MYSNNYLLRMGRQFHRPAEIKRWVFVVFEPKSKMRFESVRGIIKDFIVALRKVGKLP